MDYRNEKHKIAFEDAVRKADIRNYALMSALYLLTADRKLWISSKPHISKNETVGVCDSSDNAWRVYNLEDVANAVHKVKLKSDLS